MLTVSILIFSHGHHDGNTVTRLTWKDRIWLFDLHYINFTPRYHSGVTVAFEGRQDEPPLLTSRSSPLTAR